MKIKLSNVTFALVCVALLLAALAIGAVRGWGDDRQAIVQAMNEGGQMRTLLENRAMDAINLRVVAARHLPEDDPALRTLEEASATLLSGTKNTAALFTADDAITAAALELSQRLPEMESVQRSQRDSTYITLLTSALDKRSSLSHTYTLLAEDFNQRLQSSFTGEIAMLLGTGTIALPNTD